MTLPCYLLLIVVAVFAAAHLIVVVVSNNVAICHGILCGTFRSYEAAATAHTIFRIPYSVEVRLSVSFTLLLLFNGITKGEGERVSGEGWLRGAGGMPDFCANNMLQVSFQFQFLFAR